MERVGRAERCGPFPDPVLTTAPLTVARKIRRKTLKRLNPRPDASALDAAPIGRALHPDYGLKNPQALVKFSVQARRSLRTP